MDFMDSEESNSRQFSNADEDSNSRAAAMMELSAEYNNYNYGDSNSMSQFQKMMEEEENVTKRKLEKEAEGAGEDGPLKNGDVESDSDGPSPTKKPMLEEEEQKVLPELEKFWKAVQDDPNDFTAWTQLLQYVDQENEVEAARDAYDKFLGKYPYCYGYWKKYADYEKRKGSSEDCEKVFHRGLKAISLSVDLWIHYLNYVKATHESNLDIVRAQFEAAILACGMEFRSDKLWEHYLQWERDNNNLENVMRIYDRVLSTPTQNYQIHLQNIKEFVNQYTPEEVVSSNELIELKQAVADAETEPLDEEAELGKLRELIIERRSEIYKKNEVEITARWSFEEAIKRPYFHVKPLEKGQLKMWREYLEFEINRGDSKRVLILFERCLIACALYEEYWIKYARYLVSQNEIQGGSLTDKIEDVFHRACVLHHPNKPWINLYWAAHEESKGKFDNATLILEKIGKEAPDSLLICYRRISLERRRGNIDRCTELFKQYIEVLKDSDSSKASSVHLAIKFSRFLFKTLGDYEQAKQILLDSLEVDESTRARCIMALVDLGIQRSPVDTDLILTTFNKALSSELPEEQKVTFAHRKIEFLEDYGMDVENINKAQDELQRLAKLMREKKAAAALAAATASVDKGDKDKKASNPDDSSKSEVVAATNGTAAYDQYAYGQQYNQYGNYANWNYQQSTGYGYSQQGWNAYQGYYGGVDSTTGA